jgi:hypothetical protein
MLSSPRFPQRAWAARRALSLRCSAVSFLARASPPCFPNLAKYFVISFCFTFRRISHAYGLRTIFLTCVRGTHIIQCDTGNAPNTVAPIQTSACGQGDEENEQIIRASRGQRSSSRQPTSVVVDETAIFAMRDSGASWRTISGKLGIGVGTAHRIAQSRSKNLMRDVHRHAAGSCGGDSIAEVEIAGRFADRIRYPLSTPSR